MNNLFRNIRENANIDNIEESDDEDDFEDMREDKFVDLDKRLIIECVFHSKFRKWVPVNVLPNTPENIGRIPTIDEFIFSPKKKQINDSYKSNSYNRNYYNSKPYNNKNINT